jgi:hypothetical protein
MLIENLHFRPDQQSGPDFEFNHLRRLKTEFPYAFEAMRDTRNLICSSIGMVDLRSASSHLNELDAESNEWKQLSEQLCVAMCRQHDADLDPHMAVDAVEQAMQTAVNALAGYTDPKVGLLSEHASVVGQMSGPQEHHDPLRLLQMIIDPDRFARPIRFEAARKWELAQEALAIHLVEDKNLRSLPFLIDVFNRHIWNGGKEGATETVECVSSHDPKDFHTVETKILKAGEKVALDPYSYYHELRMRRTPNKTLAMWEHRIKPPEHKLLKLIRRRQGTPDYSLQEMHDAIGMRLVFLNAPDALEFEQFFKETLSSAGYSLVEIGRKNTLENGESFQGDSVGSSDKLEVLKAVYELNGTKFEMQLLTLRTYFDYVLADEIAHDEYNIERQAAMLAILFPHAIYGLNTPEVVNEALKRARENKPNSWLTLPPERSALKGEQRSFGKRRQQMGVELIVQQAESATWCPELIIAESSAATSAGMLSNKFRCPTLLINLNDLSSDQTLMSMQALWSGRQTLLFVNVSHTGKTLERIQSLIPEAKTGCLVQQGGTTVDFVAKEEMGGTTWYHFS